MRHADVQYARCAAGGVGRGARARVAHVRPSRRVLASQYPADPSPSRFFSVRGRCAKKYCSMGLTHLHVHHPVTIRPGHPMQGLPLAGRPQIEPPTKRLPASSARCFLLGRDPGMASSEARNHTSSFPPHRYAGRSPTPPPTPQVRRHGQVLLEQARALHHVRRWRDQVPSAGRSG